MSCAFRLKKAGREFLVLEKRSRVGGVIHTERQQGFLVEHGPNSLLLTDADIQDHLEEIGLLDDVVEANRKSSNRYIVKDGKMTALPTSPLSLLTTKAFSLGGKIRLFREFSVPSLNPDKDHSLASFFKQRLGEEIYTFAADPFISGIYAGDPEKLSVRHAFPRLWEMEQQHGSILRGMIRTGRAKRRNPKFIPRKLISFKDGMASLPLKLQEQVRPENVRLNSEIDEIECLSDGSWKIRWTEDGVNSVTDTFQHLVLTNPAYSIAQLPFHTELEQRMGLLNEISHPPIACAALGYSRERVGHALDGFGVLIPSVEGKNLLGCIFSTTLFPGRGPEGEILLQCFVGGAKNPIIHRLSRFDIVELIQPELKRLLGIQGPPNFIQVRKWKRSIPQMNIGHQKYLNLLNALEQQYPTLSFVGNYRTGVSVPNCIHAGWKAAENII